MKKLLLFLLVLCAASFHAAHAAADTAALTRQVNLFLDEWHDDAAHARLAYFDKIAPQGVFIGTDKSERWTRDEFLAWGKKHFERPSAWSFKVIQRHVAMSDDGNWIWFDEQLATQMGICQASGVVQHTAQGFAIQHYQLSLAVPNELVDYLADGVKKLESGAPAR